MKPLGKLHGYGITIVAILIYVITLVSASYVGANLLNYYELFSVSQKDSIEKKDCSTCDGNKILRMSQESIMLFNALTLFWIPIVAASAYLCTSRTKVKIIIVLFLCMALLPKIASSIAFLGNSKNTYNFIATCNSALPSTVKTWSNTEVIPDMSPDWHLYKYFTKVWKDKLRSYEESFTNNKGAAYNAKYCSYHGKNGQVCMIFGGMSNAFDAEMSDVIIYPILSVFLILLVWKAV